MVRKAAIILIHALIGWALCAAVIGVGLQLVPLLTALIIHAIAAPIVFSAVSWSYFRRFRFTTAIQTALAFTGTVVFMDFFVVALLIQKSFAMFASLLGTWIPFVLIFLSTYLSGKWQEKRGRGQQSAPPRP
jgi:hypothetical protein